MERFVELLKQQISIQISAVLLDSEISQIVEEHMYKRHIIPGKSALFQKYYFKILSNDEYYFSVSKGFFLEFKQRYSLQGIDRNYLEYLEKEKEKIMELIIGDQLPDLYFSYFRNQRIKHKTETRKKDFASFFAKLVHTFRPSEYCPLDNPIKNYFGLKKESFLVSFFAISKAYQEWSMDNPSLIQEIRDKFREADYNTTLDHSRITDLKLLDLIFWSIANPLKHTS